MGDSESSNEQRIPAILPPLEAELAGQPDGQSDPAVMESLFLEKALSKHRVDAAGLKNAIVQAHVDNLLADREMRKTYASRILRYLEWYSGGVACILLLDGFGVYGFHLQENVVPALVGSTAVAAIGLVGFIARGLFRAPPAPPDSDG